MSDDRTVFQQKPQGSLRPGVRLNGIFEIERLIAEGGMGEVYKGVAVASGDPVAIKLVRPDMARDPDVMALFKREAQTLHDLLHDAIVRYYVFSLEPELQRYYIAMEFVDGVPLQKRLADGPLTPGEARILLRRIGGALEQAHSRGVIHRDISSDNIILPGGDVRKAKIVDFGIARAARPGEGTILGGGFAGKYKYVSPEQLGLYGGEVTPKSDIYSFGLVMAEALRGEALDMGGTQVEVIEKRRAVPDLSGVDAGLRPLLTAMLAPDPADRPASMAEIAAWGEGATVLRPAEPAPAPATPKRSRAGAAIAAAAVIALCGLGAAAYLLRDDLGLGGGTTVATTEAPPTAPPTLPKLPPVGPSASEAPAPPAPTTSATVASTSVPAPPQPSASNPPGPVTAENILDDMPPKAATSETTLGPATVGVSYHAGLPAFADPGGKGLTLHATPPPPAGLAFKDLGGGRSEIAGTPTAAGQAAFEVVAVNHAAKSARMKVALAVNPKPQAPSPPEPPSPAQSVVELEPATVGAAYSAGLPPFRSQAPLALRAGPGLPDGLTLNDLGHGLSQLAGAPKAAGSYAFEVIARNESGAEARMKVRLAVAPPAPPTTAEATVSQTPTATPEPTATVAKVETPPMAASAFLRDYPPPPCFAARARDDDPSGKTITAIGADPAVFETFDAAFRKAVKAEPDLHGLVVRPKQCPAVDFLASAAPAAKPAPRIVLDNPLVGKNRPLSGTILGLGGRPLLLIVVDDDGAVFRLRPQSAGGGDSATFTANFSGDPSSFGKPQLVIAVASDRPLASDQSINGAPSAEFMPKLAAEGREAGAGAGVALFKFVQ